MYDWEKMRNIVFITPVYNDWESFSKLLEEINSSIDSFDEINFELIAVNDGSEEICPEIKIPKNLRKIEILNMKYNQGHAVCLAFGMKYAIKNYKFDYLILMDADGEDRPEEIKDLIKKAKNLNNISVVAKRVKRSEGWIFKMFYEAHKILTFIFTGKLMNFGNFSIITKKDTELICSDPNIVSNYSGTLKKNIKELDHIDCIRGKRYFGLSKMPFIKLIIHSFNIISVFKMNVFLRSALMLVLLSYLLPFMGQISIALQILIVSFNILIFYLSLQSNEKKLLDIDKSKDSTNIITH